MKKIFLLVLFLIAAKLGYSQTYDKPGNYGLQYKRLKADSSLKVPVLTDTVRLSTLAGNGDIIYVQSPTGSPDTGFWVIEKGAYTKLGGSSVYTWDDVMANDSVTLHRASSTGYLATGAYYPGGGSPGGSAFIAEYVSVADTADFLGFGAMNSPVSTNFHTFSSRRFLSVIGGNSVAAFEDRGIIYGVDTPVKMNHYLSFQAYPKIIDFTGRGYIFHVQGHYSDITVAGAVSYLASDYTAEKGYFDTTNEHTFHAAYYLPDFTNNTNKARKNYGILSITESGGGGMQNLFSGKVRISNTVLDTAYIRYALEVKDGSINFPDDTLFIGNTVYMNNISSSVADNILYKQPDGRITYGAVPITDTSSLSDRIDTKVTKGGDADGSTLTVGTNDMQQMNIETNNVIRATFSANEGVLDMKGYPYSRVMVGGSYGNLFGNSSSAIYGLGVNLFYDTAWKHNNIAGFSGKGSSIQLGSDYIGMLFASGGTNPATVTGTYTFYSDGRILMQKNWKIGGLGVRSGQIVNNGTNVVMDFFANDNVGIGTNGVNAGYKLDVNGTFRIAGSSYFNDNIFFKNRQTIYTSGNNQILDLYNSSGVVKAQITTTGKSTFINLNLSDIVEYADNAAAISGGLSVGDCYRTGDFVKIVH